MSLKENKPFFISLAWAFSLYGVVFNTTKPFKHNETLQIINSCDCAKTIDFASANISYHSVLDTIFYVSMIGLIGGIFVTKERGWIYKIGISLVWFGVFFIANPIFR